MAKIANKLPLQLTDTTGKYGLLYILPSEKNRYIVINSGIPALEVPEQDTNAWKKRWFPPMALSMSKLKDFVLYDKNKVIINSWFDEYWRIKPADEVVLKKSKMIQF